MEVSARLRRIPSWQVTLGLALLALGFLIAAQLRSEPPLVQYTTDERAPLVTTAQGLQSQQDQLKTRILTLRSQIQDLEQKGQGNAALVKQLNDSLQQAQIAAGLVNVEGTGVVLQLQDSTNTVAPGDNASDYLVSAEDVRTVVQQLWFVGAEAVAVNGERITQNTAILDIGGSVLVNSAYLAPPYQISAIGAPGLYDELSRDQGFQDFVRARAEAFGIRISFAELSDVVVPAYAGIVNLRYAHPVSPSPSPVPASPGASPAASGGSGTTSSTGAPPGATSSGGQSPGHMPAATGATPRPSHSGGSGSTPRPTAHPTPHRTPRPTPHATSRATARAGTPIVAGSAPQSPRSPGVS